MVQEIEDLIQNTNQNEKTQQQVDNDLQQQAIGLLSTEGALIGGGLGTIQDEQDSNQDSDFSENNEEQKENEDDDEADNGPEDDPEAIAR